MILKFKSIKQCKIELFSSPPPPSQNVVPDLIIFKTVCLEKLKLSWYEIQLYSLTEPASLVIMPYTCIRKVLGSKFWRDTVYSDWDFAFDPIPGQFNPIHIFISYS
jgi:hypothetical protein